MRFASILFGAVALVLVAAAAAPSRAATVRLGVLADNGTQPHPAQVSPIVGSPAENIPDRVSEPPLLDFDAVAPASADGRISLGEAVRQHLPIVALVSCLIVLLAAAAIALSRLNRKLRRYRRRLEAELAERERIGRDLARSTAEMTQIFNTAGGGMRVIDLQYTVVKVNDAYLALTGYDRDEVVGRKCHETFGGPACHTRDCTMARILGGEARLEVEIEKRRKDGSVIYCDLTTTRYLSPEGELVGIIEDFRDFTEKRRLREELKAGRDFLQYLVDSLPTPLYFKDATLRYRLVNTAFTRMVGRPAGDILGRTVEGITAPELAARYRTRDLELLEDGAMQCFEHRALFGDGVRRDVIFYKSVIRDARGAFMGITGVVLDISERKRLEQMREDVDRILRHDMKTALNGIINMPDLILEEGNLSGEQRELLGIIHDSGRRLLHMINFSLVMLQLEQGTYVPRHEPVDMAAEARAVFAELGMAAKRKRLGLRLVVNGREASGQDACVIEGEELLLRSMLSNLVLNAVEASPDGREVLISLEDNGEFQLDVKNDGAIAEAIRKDFFGKYVTHGKRRGTGLGAYSARLITRAHGGSVTFTTSEAEGTLITVRLPKRGAAGTLQN